MRTKLKEAEELIAKTIVVKSSTGSDVASMMEVAKESFVKFAGALDVVQARSIRAFYTRILGERRSFYQYEMESIPYNEVYSVLIDVLADRVELLNNEERMTAMSNEFPEEAVVPIGDDVDAIVPTGEDEDGCPTKAYVAQS